MVGVVLWLFGFVGVDVIGYILECSAWYAMARFVWTTLVGNRHDGITDQIHVNP